jgi:hypothetical protein
MDQRVLSRWFRHGVAGCFARSTGHTFRQLFFIFPY